MARSQCKSYLGLLSRAYQVLTTSLLSCSSALDPVPALSSSDQEQLLSENISLRARVEQLETLLNHDRGSRPSIPDLSPAVVDPPEPPEDIVTTFEGLHLGGPGNDLPQGPSRPAAPSNENILSLFPIRESSLKIVEFSLSTLGWVHCSLNAPRFLTDHNTFWDSLEANDRTVLYNHGWLAVYLSVLAVSPSECRLAQMLTFPGRGVLLG
jgi:hypothetical protein